MLKGFGKSQAWGEAGDKARQMLWRTAELQWEKGTFEPDGCRGHSENYIGRLNRGGQVGRRWQKEEIWQWRLMGERESEGEGSDVVLLSAKFIAS